MYIKRSPLGKGNLKFGQKKRRYPIFLVVGYVAIMALAVFVYLRLETIQPKVLAWIGPAPTPTPSAESWVELGEAAYYEGDLELAVDHYRQALVLVPNDYTIMGSLTRLLTLTEAPANLEEALALANQMILLDPENAVGYALKSRVLDWQGNYDQAVIEGLRAVEIDPTLAIAHAYLAEAYTDQLQLRLAREYAETAIQLDPFDVDARRNYGYVLEASGDYGGAIAQYEQAIQLHPNLLDLWYGLARNYRGASSLSGSPELFERSVDTYLQIIMRTPEDPRPYVELGRTYFEVREDQAAQQYLERAMSLVCEDCPLYSYYDIRDNGFQYPDGPVPEVIYQPAWLRLGNVYHTRRNYEDAIAVYEELIAWNLANGFDPPFEAYLVTAADYYYLDKCDVAIPRAFEALEIYEERRLEEEAQLENVLAVIVLCRDWALTPPTIAFEFPSRYEEPDVYLERPGTGQEDE